MKIWGKNISEGRNMKLKSGKGFGILKELKELDWES